MKNRSGKGTVHIFILLITSMIVILFVFLCVMSVIYFGVGGRQENSLEGDEYRVMRYNAKTNQYYHGLTQMKENIGDFVSYQDGNENYVLISNFNTKEFKCTGHCYCETDRRASVSLSNGLVYLVAATSSILAYNIAKEYFEGQCEQHLKETCSSGLIFSETDVCMKKEYLNAEDKDAEHEGEEGEIGEEDDTEIMKELYRTNHKRKFKCSGSCLPFHIPEEKFQYHRWKGHGLEAHADKFGCEKYELEREIVVQLPSEEFLQKLNYFTQNQLTKMHYARHHLDVFCLDKSEVNLDLIGEKKDYNLCFGHPGSYRNPTIECIDEGKVPFDTPQVFKEGYVRKKEFKTKDGKKHKVDPNNRWWDDPESTKKI